jgi:L-amino acid N-acyltransferase YncA
MNGCRGTVLVRCRGTGLMDAGAPFGPRLGRVPAHECTGHLVNPPRSFPSSAVLSERMPSDQTPRGRETSPVVSIRLATIDDAEAVRSIYNVEVESQTSTFDLTPRSIEEQRNWLAERSGAFSAVVATLETGEVVGFAALSPYKDRAAYRTTVEDSVYVSRHHGRLGIGAALMRHLVSMARDSGFHCVIARIEAGSEASRALHEAVGFELVGVERQVGRKFGRWLDVAVMQLLITD